MKNLLLVWRKSKGLSQLDLVELFNKTAKSLNMNIRWKGHYIVSRKENNKIKISPLEAKVLSKLTGFPREWFLYPEDFKKEIEEYIREASLSPRNSSPLKPLEKAQASRGL